jgi:hypothetical protein
MGISKTLLSRRFQTTCLAQYIKHPTLMFVTIPIGLYRSQFNMPALKLQEKLQLESIEHGITGKGIGHNGSNIKVNEPHGHNRNYRAKSSYPSDHSEASATGDEQAPDQADHDTDNKSDSQYLIYSANSGSTESHTRNMQHLSNVKKISSMHLAQGIPLESTHKGILAAKTIITFKDACHSVRRGAIIFVG